LLLPLPRRWMSARRRLLHPSTFSTHSSLLRSGLRRHRSHAVRLFWIDFGRLRGNIIF
jgi:hypothetical protein